MWKVICKLSIFNTNVLLQNIYCTECSFSTSVFYIVYNEVRTYNLTNVIPVAAWSNGAVLGVNNLQLTKVQVLSKGPFEFTWESEKTAIIECWNTQATNYLNLNESTIHCWTARKMTIGGLVVLRVIIGKVSYVNYLLL